MDSELHILSHGRTLFLKSDNTAAAVLRANGIINITYCNKKPKAFIWSYNWLKGVPLLPCWSRDLLFTRVMLKIVQNHLFPK